MKILHRIIKFAVVLFLLFCVIGGGLASTYTLVFESGLKPLWRSILQVEFLAPISWLFPLLVQGAFIIIAVIICFWLSLRLLPRPTKRNRSYLQKSLHSSNQRAAASSIEDLIGKIAGEGVSDTEKQAIMQLVDSNIRKVQQGINGLSQGDTLIVEGGWGSGKTTSVLVAIDKHNSQDEDRYIYESAFRYTGNAQELIHDILVATGDTLYERGVSVRSDTQGIASNLKHNTVGIIASIVNQSQWHSESLTTDFIFSINKKIRRQSLRSKVFIIIDDLDRLPGREITEVLSLLSILRRIECIRLIIPIDTKVVTHHLAEAGIHDPETFLPKYLPEQSVVRLKDAEDIVECIVRQKLASQLGCNVDDTDLLCPIWAAIIFKMCSNKLAELLRRNNYRAMWPILNFKGIGSEYSRVNAILAAQNYLLKELQLQKNNSSYKWDIGRRDVRKFYSVITALRQREGDKDILHSIYVNEAKYEEIVASWVFTFLDRQWSAAGFTLRDALDAMNNIDFSQLPTPSGQRFIGAMAKLFPDDVFKSV